MKNKLTKFFKKEDANREWLLIDLKDQTLGRVASKMATLLSGKAKVNYTPNSDNGCFIVAINASQIKLTGNKLTDKLYYRHSGYPGGFRATSAEVMLEKKPKEVIKLAVKGMLPKNKLYRNVLKNLKVYVDENHPHKAQNPKQIEL